MKKIKACGIPLLQVPLENFRYVIQDKDGISAIVVSEAIGALVASANHYKPTTTVVIPCKLVEGSEDTIRVPFKKLDLSGDAISAMKKVVMSALQGVGLEVTNERGKLYLNVKIPEEDKNFPWVINSSDKGISLESEGFFDNDESTISRWLEGDKRLHDHIEKVNKENEEFFQEQGIDGGDPDIDVLGDPGEIL